MVNEAYERWLNHPNLDPSYKEVLEHMTEKEKNDAFYTTIEFGTAGMRGLLGPGTNRINLHTIRKANEGFAAYIEAQGEEAKQRGVAIGYDNRHMSPEFAMDSARVLAKHGIRSYVFESLRPTPELSFAVRYFHCFCGIMVTASHNPKEYNGYKLYDEKGCQLVPALAQQVIDRVNAVKDELAITADVSAEEEKLITVIGKEVDEEYYKNVLSIQLNPDVERRTFRSKRSIPVPAITLSLWKNSARRIRTFPIHRHRIRRSRVPMSWRWNMRKEKMRTSSSSVIRMRIAWASVSNTKGSTNC